LIDDGPALTALRVCRQVTELRALVAQADVIVTLIRLPATTTKHCAD